ncbi:MAG: hypothetical protein QOE04_1 [Mycobacterium sp.]|nr:hypothetical protein [Mycobacterium sp.]
MVGFAARRWLSQTGKSTPDTDLGLTTNRLVNGL